MLNILYIYIICSKLLFYLKFYYQNIQNIPITITVSKHCKDNNNNARRSYIINDIINTQTVSICVNM